MKARIGNVEFEVYSEEDLKLLSKFTEDKKLFEKIEKTKETEKARKTHIVPHLITGKLLSRDNRIAQAVKLSEKEGIALGPACQKLGFYACGIDYKRAVEKFGYKKGHYRKRKPKLVILDSLPNIKGRRKSKWWTKKEKAFLDKARHDLPVGKIAKLLKRSSAAVRCQIWLLQHPEMPKSRK
jgi:hypothetical protein